MDEVTLLSIDVPGKHEGGYALKGTDGVVRVGAIKFNPKGKESDDYLTLAQVVVLANPQVVIMEHPFLHAIAQQIGAIKMLCALQERTWWMVGASKAKKLVLDNGRAEKKIVLAWAESLYGDGLTQHQADALLYLHAYITQAR